MNQTGYRHNNTSNRRQNGHSANKRQQQQQITNANSSQRDINSVEQRTILPEKTTENDEAKENSRQDFGEEQEQFPTKQNLSSSSRVEDQQQQRNKNKFPSQPFSKEEFPILPKPQASVAPVKQAPLTPSNTPKFSQNQQYNHVKSNGHTPPSYNMCTYSAYNPLPPRFQQQQQQQQQKEADYPSQRYRRRRGPRSFKRSSFPPDSAERSNDFVPSSPPREEEGEEEEEQEQQQQQQVGYHQSNSPVDSVQQKDLPATNGYSSESDILTDAPSIAGKNSHSPILSTSTGSQSSLQRLDLVRSLATSHGLLDELISIFDTTSFSSDELELILDKIATTHVLDKHDLQRLKATTKNEKIFERIRDETYRSQAKILAIELQTEKSRILELTKSNADMENTIRQLLQQQQQQQQPNMMIQYQQMMIPYQLTLRRYMDENARLQQQLHAYSMMPATLNELKQQEHILHEQIRQMSIRTCALENEVAESERASKHAAEIYKKADSQKQERLEQMIADINRYKKLDKELTALRQKYTESEKHFDSRITTITKERDEFQSQCEQLKDKVQRYEQMPNSIHQEINQLKNDNDQLRQSNWKQMDQVNKLSKDRPVNQTK